MTPRIKHIKFRNELYTVLVYTNNILTKPFLKIIDYHGKSIYEKINTTFFVEEEKELIEIFNTPTKIKEIMNSIIILNDIKEDSDILDLDII